MSSLAKLSSLIELEHQAASSLLELLEAEQTALIKSNSEQLTEILVKKQPLIIELEQLSKQRVLILGSEGFPADKEGLLAFIRSQPSNEAKSFQQKLKSLREIAQSCHKQNQINGGITNVNRQYIYRAMSILKGNDGAASGYGPAGEFTQHRVNQPLLGRV